MDQGREGSELMSQAPSWARSHGVRRSRRTAYEARTGRRAVSERSAEETTHNAALTATYEQLQVRLDSFRDAVAADGYHSLFDVRRAHADLAQALVDAVRQAFVADASAAPTPAGITSWAAEGLARSEEQELALLAATDVSGILQTMTVPVPSWGPLMR
jgi:hypothetical protein